MNKKYYLIIGLVLILSVGIFVYAQEQEQVGSVSQTSEYIATSTASNTSGFLYASSPFLIKNGYGTFGSYIVTKAGTAGGRVNFYNATTTNRLKRASSMGTSSIIITSFPTDLAAGTYTFDVAFSYGLTMDWLGGAIGTSTATYR